jgi:hypothetical protein
VTPKIIGLVAAGVLALAGCTGQAAQDRESGAGLKPDRVADASEVVVWRNADDIPNVATFCADGLAWAATLSRDGVTAPQLLRLPERDARCAR